MKQALILVYNFFKNPNPNPAPDQKIVNKIKWLFSLLILQMPFIWIAMQLQQFLFRNGLVSSEDHLVGRFMQEKNTLLLAFFMILFIPFIEEIVFRLPLQFKKINFIPLIVIGVLIVGFSLAIQLKLALFIAVPILVILTGWLFFLLYNKKTGKKWELVWSQNYRFVFYTFAIAFALLHLTNFPYSIGLLLFAPIVVLPQFIGGLLMGFLRVKQGFIWGFFLHALYNTVFFLSALWMTQSTPKLIDKIDKDGYTFITAEGYYFDNDKFRKSHPNTSTDKITPNEIILYSTFKRVVAKLSRTNERNIHFKNSLLAEKKISVYFKNDSAFESPNALVAQHLVLENLLEAHKLKSKAEFKKLPHWQLTVHDEELFQSMYSKNTSRSPNNKVRNFYGRNDTLKFVDTDSDFLAKAIRVAFDVEVKNKVDPYILFSIEIPNDDFSKLNAYLKSNYGLALEKKTAKERVLTVY